MKKTFFSLLAALVTSATAQAQAFDDYFEDRTLRVDYIFSGSHADQQIAVDELLVSPHWYGKRHRLADTPVEGNGQIIVRDHRSRRVIYRNAFSTLFQEWQQEPEALRTRRAFENVFLVPMPKDTVDITVQLRDNRRQVCASQTHQAVSYTHLTLPTNREV